MQIFVKELSGNVRLKTINIYLHRDLRFLALEVEPSDTIEITKFMLEGLQALT
jgi:hypothetical protein